MKTHKTLFSAFLSQIKSLFISGLLTILPLALTVTLFVFLYRTIRHWFRPVYNILPDFLKAIPLSELLIVVLLIIGLGFILRVFVIHPLIESAERVFGRLPLVRQVYFGIKQLIHALNPKKEDERFRSVVLVEFTRKGTYSIGFLTSDAPSGLVHASVQEEHGLKRDYYNVFIPHTPLPTSGFFILVPVDECIPTTLTHQEAMTIVISGGIIQPDRFVKKS